MHCAESITPWNAHPGSEEHPSDARFANELQHPCGQYFSVLSGYFDAEDHSIPAYRYGYPFERQVENFDSIRLSRPYSMARISHEKAIVMPEGQTVYLADDECPRAL